MATTPPAQTGAIGSEVPGFNMREIALNVLVDAGLPFAAYQLLTGHGVATVPALLISGIFPIAWSVAGLIRARRVDIIGGIVLIGIAVSIIAALIGGDAKMLLIRESFVTGALGIVALVSLFAPRPLIFYFARQMVAGSDRARLASFDAGWQRPWVPGLFRKLTIVWGLCWAGEFSLRVVLVSLLTVPQALAITPILFNLITAALIFWTFAYVRRVRGRHMDRPVAQRQVVPAISAVPRATTRARARPAATARHTVAAAPRHSVSARRRGARRVKR